MDWIKPSDKLPPQGKKILYFSDGYICVVHRFGKYWLPIPFLDSKWVHYDEPELWADIYPPGNLTGKLHALIDNEMHDIDSLEKHHPDQYKELMDNLLKYIKDK
jgi:hypothetical protein